MSEQLCPCSQVQCALVTEGLGQGVTSLQEKLAQPIDVLDFVPTWLFFFFFPPFDFFFFFFLHLAFSNCFLLKVIFSIQCVSKQNYFLMAFLYSFFFLFFETVLNLFLTLCKLTLLVLKNKGLRYIFFFKHSKEKEENMHR